MDKIAVLESQPGHFIDFLPLTVASLDSERRASIGVLLSDSVSDNERATFGLFLVEPAAVPDGKRVIGRRYERHDGEVIQILDLADIPPTVPTAVSPRQLRLALLGAGKLDQINAFVASPAVPPAARISWEYATEYRRDDPMLNEMASHLDPPLAAEQIDQLFVAAAAIQ